MTTIWATMMTSKTKKKRFDSLFGPLRHRFSPFRHLISVRATSAFLAFLYLLGGAITAVPAPAPQSSSSSGSRAHAHDFLIFTTVFTDKGFTLYGARTRLRRAEEKKYRWEAMSDHSGELAFRVPQGAEYEMTIEAKGFKTQTRKIDARDDIRADLAIRMEPLSDSPAAPGADAPNGGKP